MNKSIAGKSRTVFFCILMIFIQLAGMSGCAATDLISEMSEPVIDNDLVVDVNYEGITFKVGQLWEPAESDDGVYFYPGTNFLYYVSCIGTFREHVKEENYISYVIEYLRRNEGLDNVVVIEKMTPYVTADNRNAFISRLLIKETANGTEFRHDADLVIIPSKRYFALFDVVYQPGETVPLDIRELTDTATFDLGPDNVVAGFSFFDENRNTVIQFTDSENFVTYIDADNRDALYAYGTYEFYIGDEAIEQVSDMKEYGLTEDEIELSNRNMGIDDENFVAIVFEIKGYVDEEGNDNENDITSLYIGSYIEEDDALDLLNCNTISFYYLVKEESEE